jgi:quercetin dioxygenase-like cupin family protein
MMPNPRRYNLRPFVLIVSLSIFAITPGTGRLGITAASAAEVVQLDPASRIYKLPDQIPWKKSANGGTESAMLVGDPSKPGLYIQLLKRPPNNWSRPHKHDHDRYITVLEGTMWVGTGDDFDIEKTVGLKAGSFLRDFGGQTHFDGSKADGLVIQIMGIVPPKTGAASAQ